MDRINTPNSVPDGNGPGKRGFRDGNKAEGINPTEFNAKWCNTLQEELAAIAEHGGGALDPDNNHQVLDKILALVASVSGITQSAADARYIRKQLMILQDEKSSGTNGGASSTGMNIRTLNTVSFNNIPGASLSANQITLPSGIYRISGRAPAAKCDTHKSYLFNVTDNANAIVGASVNASAAGTSDQVYTDSWINGRLTLTATKVFEFRHWILTGAGTDGLGANCNFPGLIEVYAQLEIIREGD